MNKIPSCLKSYLKNTTSGNRNINLFTTMKKIKELNPRLSQPDLHKICKELNTNLPTALNQREVRAITKSIYEHDYKSSCIPFKQYCDPSIHCKFNKPYNAFNKNYLKHLTRKNQVKKLLPAVHACPWDFEDLSKLTPEQAKIIREFREEKGINPKIDSVLIYNGLKVGDEALTEYKKHCGMIK